jgi:hypothetical protein
MAVDNGKFLVIKGRSRLDLIREGGQRKSERSLPAGEVLGCDPQHSQADAAQNLTVLRRVFL